MPTPADAICQEVAWKSPELRRFCVALVDAALAQTDPDFTTDIVSDETRTLGAIGEDVGHGMAGSAITILKHAGVIKPVGITQSGVFYAHRRASDRPGAKSRWLNVYQLTSPALARKFLERNRSTAPSVFSPQPSALL